MNKGAVKTAVLVLLIIGVIVQTGRLWFEESSGHNFFSSIMTARTRVAEERYEIEPESIMIGLGGSRFIKLDEGRFPSVVQAADPHIAQLLRAGRFIGAVPLSWGVLLDQKAAVYQYPFPIPAEAFARSYGERGADFRSRVSVFDTIVIKPARVSSESTRVYVADSAGGEMFVFEAGAGVSPLYKEIDELGQAGREQETGPPYISSALNSLDFFTGNVFLPEWQEAELSYSKPYITNPIEEAGNLEECARLFFDSPVGLLSATDPAGAPFVSDKEAVVKYFGETGVLEYTSYGVQERGQNSLDEAYAAARNFLRRDRTLANDVRMTEGFNQNGEWRLFFDYYWHGARAFTAPEGVAAHAIEITVSGGGVSGYRRVVRRLDDSELYGQHDENFIAALDRILAEDAEQSGAIDTAGDEKLGGLELAFDVYNTGFSELSWFAETDGEWRRR